MTTTFLQNLRASFWRSTMIGLERGAHITRYAMYDDLQKIRNNLPKQEGDVLSISDSTNFIDLLGIKPTSITEANYPDHNFLSLQFPDQAFDFVFSDQVLEHVEGDPQQAIDESWRVLRPGGIAVHTTCFINPIHPFPKDFWRFTPDALALLGRKFSRVIDCKGWGNFDAWLLIRDGLRFEGIPHASWHPLHRLAIRNDPDWPIVTWIILEK
jgi:SAM-dependent methyltransferase